MLDYFKIPLEFLSSSHKISLNYYLVLFWCEMYLSLYKYIVLRLASCNKSSCYLHFLGIMWSSVPNNGVGGFSLYANDCLIVITSSSTVKSNEIL